MPGLRSPVRAVSRRTPRLCHAEGAGQPASAVHHLLREGIEVKALGDADVDIVQPREANRSFLLSLPSGRLPSLVGPGYGRHISATFHRYREQYRRCFMKGMEE